MGCAEAVYLLGVEGSAVPAGRSAALVLAACGLALPTGWSVPLLLVAAHSLPLLTAHALGSLAPVDAMILAIVARVVVTRRNSLAFLRTLPVLGAICFVAAGAAATAASPENAALTAFLRVSAYLTLGVALIPALSCERRRWILLAMVGVAIGDALGALAGVTGRASGPSVGGRYLGTLGDPAQFGIPIGVALMVVVSARWLGAFDSRRAGLNLTLNRGVRVALAALLAVALIGSRTRAAFVAAFAGAVGIVAFGTARSGVSAWVRFAVAAVIGATVVAGAGAFSLGAKDLGFDSVSAHIRIESLQSSWDYVVAHPFRPTGLGNLPGRFPAYNTWLALTVALTPVAALGLAVFIGSGLVRAFRLPGPEWFAAALGFLGATMTENMVFAGSSMTLSWFILNGLVLGYTEEHAELDRNGAAPP